MPLVSLRMKLEIMRQQANKFQAIARNAHSPLSDQSKIWLHSLALIKMQIEFAALELMESWIQISKGNVSGTDVDHYWGREDQYRSWSQEVKYRALRNPHVTKDEAWFFISDQRSLWIWQVLHMAIQKKHTNLTYAENVESQRTESAVFANLAVQLESTASRVKVDELAMLSEIIDVIELQLSMLGSFGHLYHRNINQGENGHSSFSWSYSLRPNIAKAIERADASHPKYTRSPSQHHQDNTLLQATIGIFLLACIYPLFRVLDSSPPTPGSTSEANFWQQISNTIIQLAGFLTMLLPIYRETAAKQWVGTWVLTVLGILSALIAIPLYLFVPVLWSAFFSWLASAAQLLVVLQIALVAAFQDEEHVKKD